MRKSQSRLRSGFGFHVRKGSDDVVIESNFESDYYRYS